MHKIKQKRDQKHDHNFQIRRFKVELPFPAYKWIEGNLFGCVKIDSISEPPNIFSKHIFCLKTLII